MNRVFTLILILNLVLYGFFIYRTWKSNKPVKLRKTVIWMLSSMFAPVIGNAIVVVAQTPLMIRFGYVLYMVGAGWLVYFILRFVVEFCDFPELIPRYRKWLICLILVDNLSIWLNPVFKHVFTIVETVGTDGVVSYSFDVNWYFRLHVAGVTLLMLAVIGLLIYRLTLVSTVYMERYVAILAILSLTVIWEVLLQADTGIVDTGMLGYELAGFLIYLFSIEYKPFLLTDRMLASVVSNISDAIFFFNNEDECIYFNREAQTLFGLEDGDFEAARKAVEKLIPAGEDFFSDDISRRVRVSEDGSENHRSIGSSFDLSSSVETIKTFSDDKVFETEFRRIFDKKHAYTGFFVSASDRTNEEMQMLEERHKATHDPLTGILNREELYRETEQVLAENPTEDYLVVTSDIKEFKLINDIFGDSVGDEVLIRLTRTVQRYLQQGDRFGRIGGDRFGLIMRKATFQPEVFIEGAADIAHVAKEFHYPIIIHIGVYEVTNRKINAPTMYDRAFLAIESIKNDVQKRIAFYDDSLRKERLWEQMIMGSLDDALSSGDIVPFIQPQVSADGKVHGGEALVRWNHATEGFLNPGRFMETLESNGLVVKVDTFIWESACKTLRRWEDEGRTGMYLSVNISPKDFYFVDIYETVTSLVKKYKLRPEQLRLEITESSIMNDLEQKIEIINRLRNEGFILEMDDFGSGYSSLNMLKDMPIDVLKIDMLFLRSSETNENTRIILRHIIQMAKQMKMDVITEGVETEEQVSFLKEMGCDTFQGYYFGKPVSVREFEQTFLRQ